MKTGMEEMIRELQVYLICLLAGRRPIILNAEVNYESIVFKGNYLYMKDCVFKCTKCYKKMEGISYD